MIRIILYCAILVVAACGKHADLSGEYRKNGIELNFQAPTDLNKISDRPHILHYLVYQLSDSGGFSKLASSEEGLLKLMEGKPFDSTVLDVKRPTPLKPGAKTTELLDKVEGTRFAALVACYSFDITRENVSRVFAIPIDEIGIINTQKITKKLRVDFVMGASRIVNAEKKAARRLRYGRRSHRQHRRRR